MSSVLYLLEQVIKSHIMTFYVVAGQDSKGPGDGTIDKLPERSIIGLQCARQLSNNKDLWLS